MLINIAGNIYIFNLTLYITVFPYCAAVNYVAISDALDVPPSILAAGLAADNVICAVYFSTLFLLASKIPPESSASVNGSSNSITISLMIIYFIFSCHLKLTCYYNDLVISLKYLYVARLCASVHHRVHLTLILLLLLDDTMTTMSGSGDKLPVLQMATSLAVSFAMCKVANILTGYFGIQGGNLPLVTAIAVIFATVFPKPFASLAPSGEAMAVILIQVGCYSSWTGFFT